MNFFKRIFLISFGLLHTVSNGQQDPDSVNPITNIKSTYTIKALQKTKAPALTLTMDKGFMAKSATGNVSREAGSTLDQLDTSGSGGVIYNIPISTAPGINNVVPQISLSYNGQAKAGLAGYGWNITGISVISHTNATPYHDGRSGSIDFTKNDRYTLDGQRLLLKSGGYGDEGSEYQTENYSNIKVKAYGTSPLDSASGPAYFVVFYPDGSRSWYGNGGNAISRMEWALFRTEDPQGNAIQYSYYFTGELLRIKTITYGFRGNETPTASIKFRYKDRIRPEQMYIAGHLFTQNHIMNQIQTFSKNSVYRSYTLAHQRTFLGYERISTITESNASNKSFAPIVLRYDTSPDSIESYRTEGQGISIFPGVDYKKHAMSAGDFSGNGSMDMVLYDKKMASAFHLFTEITKGNKQAIAYTVKTDRFKTLFPSTILTHNGKLFSQQAITLVQEKKSGIRFRTYAKSAVGIHHQYDKDWVAENYIKDTNCSLDPQEFVIPRRYVSGDFNGDGLSDVLAIQQSYRSTTCDRLRGPNCNDDILSDNSPCCDCAGRTVTSPETYWIDLKRTKEQDFANFSGRLKKPLHDKDKLMALDFNSDGRTDLYHFSEGQLDVYELTDAHKLFHIYNLTYDGIKLEYPILFGDYNGDNKIDFTIPAFNKNSIWVFYFGTGTSVTKLPRDIGVWFSKNEISRDERFEGEYPNIRTEKLFEYQYVAQDFNGDGKTDILSHHIITRAKKLSNYKLSIERMKVYSNQFSKEDNTLDFKLISETENNNKGIRKHGIPVFLDINRKTSNLEYAYIDGNSIYGFEFKKDHRKDVLLRGIENNGLSTTITYDGDADNFAEPAYSPSYDALYPFINVPRFEGIPLVRKFTQKASGVIRQQDFYYHGATSHQFGLGFLGFSLKHRSNWHGDAVGMLWDTTRQDPLQRGATIAQWTTETMSSNPADFVSKTINTYQQEVVGQKVFKNVLTRSITKNGLTGISTTRSISYDAYQHPQKIKTSHKDGDTQLVYTYANNPSALDATYHMGRITEQREKTTLKGESFTTAQFFTYQNNLLTQLGKQSNNSPVLISSFGYDAYGNMVYKEAPGSGVPRRISYAYDITGRFMTATTNHLGLKTTYVHNTTTGSIIASTDPYGLTSTYRYDGWNREIEHQDHLGNTTNTTYTSGTDGGIGTHIDHMGGADKVSVHNRWGWMMSVQSLSRYNKEVKKSFRYDAAGKVLEESEPYFANQGATQWSKNYYDTYGRIIHQQLYTGRNVTTRYEGLTVTVNDGTKTTKTTLDATGNISEMIDAGGTVQYAYYGNGLMKNADYDNYRIAIGIDDWGRKTSLQDPSAGTYTYRYNDIGELLEETTPKGKTNYTYAPSGLISKKAMTGDHTKMDIAYVYDSKFRTIAINATGADTESYHYTYAFDRYNKVSEVTEDITGQEAGASYRLQMDYDRFGRPTVETYEATNQMDGAHSSTTVSKHYDNIGFLSEIRDQKTNKVLWKINAENQRGQALDISLGNGFTKTRTFDPYGNAIQIKDQKIVSGTAVAAMHMTYQFDPIRGLLNKRQNHVLDRKEDFKYDAQDRLTHITGDVTHTQAYDPRGRISNNTSVGDYTYHTTRLYQLKDIALNSNGDTRYNTDTYQKVTYNAFKKPVEIYQVAKDWVHFTYGPMMNRTTSYFGNMEVDKKKRPMRRLYASIIPVEMLHDIDKKATRISTYINGDAYTAPIVYNKEHGTDGTDGYQYIHRDYLGSILGITDATGTIVEQNHFGAWGKLDVQHVVEKSGTFSAQVFLLGRGFTGHEHLDSVGLVLMNGRMYDPEIHRFLSPDNFIQDAYSTQSYDRYGYVWNNPLVNVDPDGELVLVAMGIGALVGGVIAAIQKNVQLVDIVKGVIIGAAAGIIGAKVGAAAVGLFGNAVTTSASFWSGAAVGASSGFAGGFVGGSLTALSYGQSFGDSLLNGLKMGAIGGITGGAISGISGYVKASGQRIAFRKGMSELGLEASDPVPQTDAFAKKAQRAWFPDAPTDNLVNHSIENVPQTVIDAMNVEGAAATTIHYQKGGVLTGNSSIYYNPNGAAFTSAKQLFYAMGHEFVHVSQYKALGALGMKHSTYSTLWENGLEDIIEFHGYSFENVHGSTNRGDFGVGSAARLMKLQPELFKALNYTNFSWIHNVNFKYPF